MKRISKLNIISLISVVISILFIISLVLLGILPISKLLIIITFYVIINIIGIVFINLKSSTLKLIGSFILILVSIISIVISYYTYSTNSFLDKSFNSKDKESITYYVVALKDNNYTKKDIKDNISYYENSTLVNDALKKLKNTFKVDSTKYSNPKDLFNDLNDKKIKYFLIEKTSYNIITDLDQELNKDNYSIIYKFNISKKINKNNTNPDDSFNIYIGGSDFVGMMDFNMLVSVNQTTHKVLLTSIPRDYYIEVAGYNKKDKLSFITQGIDVSMASLENLFDTKIDYYVKIDTNSLVTLVDEIGGIEYCSDVEFTTSHAKVKGTYNDFAGSKLHIIKGCQHLNGIEALTVSRERNAFPGRDRVRQANCQKIMLAILKKLVSVNTITNYNETLNTIANTYETNIPKNILTNNIKDILTNGNKWTIDTQAVDGTDGKDLVHLDTMTDWVMYPNYDTVNQAIEKIKNTL